MCFVLYATTSSCSLLKKSHTETEEKHSSEKIDAAKLITTLSSVQPDFKWLQTNGTVSYNGQDAKIAMKMYKDSLVWASVNFLIELARGQVNNDSATLLIRPEKSYVSFPTDSLKQWFAIDNLSLASLQRIMLAFPPFQIDTSYSFDITDGEITLSKTTPTYHEFMSIDKSSFNLTNYTYKRSETDKITIHYSDFKKEKGMNLPGKIELNVINGTETNISLSYIEYSTSDEDNAGFFIPQSYHQRKP